MQRPLAGPAQEPVSPAPAGRSTAPSSLAQFFDALTADYAAAIERCFPRYREMLWALLDYLPRDRAVIRVLELGSGTGNLSVLLDENCPTAELFLVDLSDESLAVCRERLGQHERLHYVCRDIRELSYPQGTFDLILSSIAIHHLEAAEKQALFAQCYRWLSPRGVLAYADQCRGATDDLYARHQQHWRAQSQAAGASDEEFAMWMAHQHEHDHHDTLADQLAWLTAAGFPVVDCMWRYLLWSVVQARKS